MAAPFSTSQPIPPTQASKKKKSSAMSDNNLTVLRQYAGYANPSEVLPKSILFATTDDTVTVFDAFPKSIFHLLVLPRSCADPKDIEDAESTQSTLSQFAQGGKSQKPKPEINKKLPTAHQVRNLPTMLSNLSKDKSKAILMKMQDAALSAKKEIEEEMIRIYGWKWEVWIGFHAIPSMEHLHLHVMSADLVSNRIKNKKHYNTFHPKLGFFVQLEEVLEWFEAGDAFFNNKVRSLATLHPILKHDLVCFHCEQVISNIPRLREHLQEEWNKIDKQRKAAQARAAMFAAAAEKKRQKAEESQKRKSEEMEGAEEAEDQDGHLEKRQRTDEL